MSTVAGVRPPSPPKSPEPSPRLLIQSGLPEAAPRTPSPDRSMTSSIKPCSTDHTPCSPTASTFHSSPPATSTPGDVLPPSLYSSSISNPTVQPMTMDKFHKKSDLVYLGALMESPHVGGAFFFTSLIVKTPLINCVRFLEPEVLPHEAVIYVTLASAIYSLVKPYFLETIPENFLPRDESSNRWRVLMNSTVALFFTMLMSPVVKYICVRFIGVRYEISTTTGNLLWVATFGLPYMWLYGHRPDPRRSPIKA